VIAADGHASGIRQALGIERSGRGQLQTMRSILFRAPIPDDLAAKVAANRERGIVQYSIEQPAFTGFLARGLGDDSWLLMFPDDRDRDEDALQDAARTAIGIGALDATIIATGRWDASALIADRFAQGRVFLAGDAAHTLPPSRGGYGANTGIEDVHNLAWKLAAVLSGASRPALLDTYDAERRPVAWLRHDQIFARPDYAAFADTTTDTPILDDVAIELGQLYRSAALCDNGAVLPAALRPDQWAGQPGTRAPHMWLTRRGHHLSTLDLFGHGWALLTDDENWREASELAAKTTGISLEYLPIGTDLLTTETQQFRTAFGLAELGASLIRPDGYIAWRSVDLPADPAAALTSALRHAAAASRTAGPEGKGATR
jgi:putative polyketide hydroxylase